MIDRLTLDIDTYRTSYLLKTLIKANYYLQNIVESVKVSISPTRKGFHVVFGLTVKLSKKQKEVLRRKLGDDYNRIEHDENRPKEVQQTLFSTKIVRNGNGKMKHLNSVAVWYFENIFEAIRFIEHYKKAIDIVVRPCLVNLKSFLWWWDDEQEHQEVHKNNRTYT